MAEPIEYWFDVLKENKGFAKPEQWIEYAKEHGFRKVNAIAVEVCPDCGSVDARKIGQYIYYSNLALLLTCGHCNLLYCNVRIDNDTVSKHFDTAYTDEKYFAESRKDTFDQIVTILKGCAPVGGRILDIGGAKGHLMAALQDFRSDLTLVVNDVSLAKCEWARQHYGFHAVCATASEVCSMSHTFDVLSMIDVMYYEPDLAKLWSGLDGTLRQNGTLILRVPNHYGAIVIRQAIERLFSSATQREMQDDIAWFNPEHLYVFSKKYLKKRLGKLGFTHIRFVPSALFITDMKWRPLCRGVYILAKVIYYLSLRTIICTPSMLVIARR
jgi:SAM-dependent methyltransferase